MSDTTTSGTPRVPDVVLFQSGSGDVTATSLLALPEALPVIDAARTALVTGRRALERAQADRVDLAEARKVAERTFRNERRLGAADDMRSWLESWHLDVSTWRTHVARVLAASRADGATTAPAVAGEADDGDLWATLVCGGGLRELATTEAARHAAADALGASPRDPDVVRRFLDGTVTDARVDHELAERALDWLRVSWHLLEAPHLDAAREACLCLVDDGLTPQEVGELLGTPDRHGRDWLHAAPPDLRGPLLEVDVGGATVLAPADDDPARVLHVDGRDRPSPDDPTTREAVRTALAARAIDDERRNRIRWHVTF